MWRRVVLGAMLASLVLAACSGGDDGGEDAATRPSDETAGAAPEDEPTATAGAQVTEDQGAGSATTETSTEDEATEAARAGGTLVVAIDSDPGGLNPAITTQGGTHTASELLYNGLVGLDDDLQPVPELAESWEIEDDGRVYTFTLRDDVVWHDGEPFTSADVVFSFEEVLTELHSRTAASLGQALESVEAPDDTTVVFTFAEPYAPLLLQLDVTEAPIVPRHVYEGTDLQENPANNAPIGTGPFRFVSYEPDSEIVFEANPDYFVDGQPQLDRIVQRIIPERSTQIIALEAGEVDWLWSVSGPDRERLLADDAYGSLETSRNPGGANCIMTVSFNLERPLFQDVELRRAIAQAIDREAFLQNVIFGEGRVAEAPISSGIPWAHGEGIELPAYDVVAAEAALDAAGWVREGGGVRTAQGVEGVEDGTPLAFDFVAFPTFQRYGELLRTQLAAVGAEVELRPLDPPVFAETVFTNRDFDTNIISYCNGNDPEIGVRRMFDSRQIGPVPFSNAAAYSNPEVDALLDEARGLVDVEDRTPIYQELQEIVAADLPYIPIVETLATRVFDAACSGFVPYGHFAAAATCEGA